MKLNEYFLNLKKLLDENPNLAEAEVVTAIDEEGNGYNRVYFPPSHGTLIDGEWNDASEIQVKDATHVCLN